MHIRSRSIRSFWLRRACGAAPAPIRHSAALGSVRAAGNRQTCKVVNRGAIVAAQKKAAVVADTAHILMPVITLRPQLLLLLFVP